MVKAARIKLTDDGPQVEVLGEDGKVVATLTPELPDGVEIEDVAGLRSALEDEKAKRRTAMERIKAMEAEAKKAEAKRAKEQGGDAAREAEERFAEERAQMAAAKAQLEAELHNRLLEAEVSTALAKHKGKLGLLSPVLKTRGKVEVLEDGTRRVVVVDSDGKPQLSKRKGQQGQPMTLDELTESLKADKDFLPAFEGNGVGGSGASHATGGPGRVIGTETDPLNPDALFAQYHARQA